MSLPLRYLILLPISVYWAVLPFVEFWLRFGHWYPKQADARDHALMVLTFIVIGLVTGLYFLRALAHAPSNKRKWSIIIVYIVSTPLVAMTAMGAPLPLEGLQHLSRNIIYLLIPLSMIVYGSLMSMACVFAAKNLVFRWTNSRTKL